MPSHTLSSLVARAHKGTKPTGTGGRRKFSQGPAKRRFIKRVFSAAGRFGIAPTMNEDAHALHELDLKARKAEKSRKRDTEAVKLMEQIRKAGRAGARTLQMLSVRKLTSKIRAYNFGSDTRPRFLGLSETINAELRRHIRVRHDDLVEATMGIVYNKSAFPVQEIFIRIADPNRHGFKLFELKPRETGILYAKVASQLMAKAEAGELHITEAEREHFSESEKKFTEAMEQFVHEHGTEKSGTITIPRQALGKFPIQAEYLQPALIAEELKRKSETLIAGKQIEIQN